MKTFLLIVLVFIQPLLLLAEEEAKAKSSGHPFSWPFVGWENMQPYGGTTKATPTELDTSTKASFNAIYEKGLSKKEQDRRAILALVGDHRVSFDFIEVASSTEDYQPPRPYFSWTTERAFVIKEKKNFISIQHIMVMEYLNEEGEVQGPFVMKHWRQDWSFQDRDLLEYQGEKTWIKRTLHKQKGTWVQAVYQVDDSPRYQAVGKWTHQGGMSIFRTKNFWRPLPRREFSARNDYNVLSGHHEITITPTGWLHTQINQKLLTKKGEIKKMLATEIGAVRYEQITTPSLELAENYWEKTGEFWKTVRNTWTALENSGKPINLQSKIDNKPMYAHLFEIADQLKSSTKLKPAKQDLIKANIQGIGTIGLFLAPPHFSDSAP